MGFIAQCYEDRDGELVYSGHGFESAMVAEITPIVGDIIVLPATKKFDDPQANEQNAFKIIRRFIEVDPQGGPTIVRLVVTREFLPIIRSEGQVP